jgi:hypothetical protein
MSKIALTEEALQNIVNTAVQAALSAEATVNVTKKAPQAPRQHLSVVFEKLEGEEAEKYGDISITKLLPNGNPRKRMVLTIDDAARFADFVVENFADRLE